MQKISEDMTAVFVKNENDYRVSAENNLNINSKCGKLKTIKFVCILFEKSKLLCVCSLYFS